MQISIERQIEAVAAMLTMVGLYLLTINDPLGFIIGAIGSALWMLLAYELKLWFMMALNAGLILININGAI